MAKKFSNYIQDHRTGNTHGQKICIKRRLNKHGPVGGKLDNFFLCMACQSFWDEWLGD